MSSAYVCMIILCIGVYVLYRVSLVVVYACVLVALIVCSCVWLCPSSTGCT